MNKVIRFLKDWTLPCAIATGSTAYLTFYWVPQLDALGNSLGPVFDVIFPVFVFLTLLVTFCKIDFHQLRPHRWHVGILVAQLLLVALNVAIIFWVEADREQKLICEALLTCIIGPAASAAPVVVGKLGGNISTMTTYVLLSSVVSSLLIPLVFPMLEQTVHVEFLTAFLVILNKVAMVLLLPLVLGWIVQHHLPRLQQRIASMPNLSFYCWAMSLSITSGITVKNIVHSHAAIALLLWIAVTTLLLCFVQFVIGRGVGRWLGGGAQTATPSQTATSAQPTMPSQPTVPSQPDTPAGIEVNAGQALFQKNTALSIWVAYMYLNPVASVGAGCYVLWQNVINSIEIWDKRKQSETK